MNFNSIHNNQIQFFESILFEGLGKETTVNSYEFLSGGNINNAVKLDTTAGYFFVKWNESEHAEAFACEARGLELLRSTQEIAVPDIIAYGHKMQKSYIMLNYIDQHRPQAGYWEHFGRSLAKLHSHTHTHFGLDYNNYIGSLKQSNEWQQDGVQFFIEKRLKVQAGLALYNGEIPRALYDKFDSLYKKLPEVLPAEKPALLHGDLWSGNVMVGSDGWVCLIDPAVYYGNREAELAFTKLFGGFNPAFYQSYTEAYPLEKGFEERIDIYNLYPLLVHVNLFGSGYLSGIEKVLKRF
jgi:protein-ribulosamine 3-kinase